jgi:hypothetical protein
MRAGQGRTTRNPGKTWIVDCLIIFETPANCRWTWSGPFILFSDATLRDRKHIPSRFVKALLRVQASANEVVDLGPRFLGAIASYCSSAADVDNSGSNADGDVVRKDNHTNPTIRGLCLLDVARRESIRQVAEDRPGAEHRLRLSCRVPAQSTLPNRWTPGWTTNMRESH